MAKAEAVRYGVGVVGANPERGWALAAHLPAVGAIDRLDVAAVATTRMETARASAERFGAAKAYADWRELVADPAVNIVAVCVKVAHHREIALGAIAAGKHVFCEWPLGIDAREAEEIRSAADKAGVTTMVGLQGRASPYLETVRGLVAEGAIGKLVSATLVSSLNNWGPRLPASEAYRTKKESGATGLTVPGGHSLDSFCHMLGAFCDLTALVTTQHPLCEIVETGEIMEVTAPDQVLVTGRLVNGAVATAHIKADMANPTGVRLEINGTDGDIVVTTRPPVGVSPVGIQRVELDVAIARRRKKPFEPVAVETADPRLPSDLAGPPYYTARLYLRLIDALDHGRAPTPSFADAVATHKLLEAIQAASDTGTRQSP
ncbi:MAG: Gfo/Idh/MocA family oxidoreductase [Rhizobiaceae bacterium]